MHLLAIGLTMAVAFQASAAEWKPLFNGKDLTGWSGDPRLWKVEDGVLIGETDGAEKKVAANTFLIWKGGEPSDFELEYKAKVEGNNSGIQYRSSIVDPATWSVGGYQMDLHPDAKYLGMLYEERGRGIACQHGQKVDLGEKPTVTGQFEMVPAKLAEWNDYRIVAKGPLLRHYVNGKLIAEINDTDEKKRALKGTLAMQLHAGPSMKAWFKDVRLKAESVAAASTTNTSAVAPSGDVLWIWKDKKSAPKERVFFRREFSLPKDVTAAAVTVTCDNWQQLWVNGKDYGFAGDWSVAQGYDVLKDLKAGAKNVIAVEGRNTDGVAAMALRLTVTLKGGKKITLVSDTQWQCSSETSEGWQLPDFKPAAPWAAPVVIAKMGDAPWNMVIGEDASGGALPKNVTADYQVAKDFKLESLYKVPKPQGSWVAMTVDGKGRLLCSDQYGIIYRVTPSTKEGEETKVEPTDIPLKGAHGLLWHEGVLYVSVNEGTDQSGVWMVTDSNGDGEPDKPKLLKAFEGRGEHGPHGFAPSPDGKWIYVTAGNFTDLPEMDTSLVTKVWEEDQLLPRRPDAKGHARDRMAPGGWVARFKPDGSFWQLFSMGFRNAYDIAFNDRGDLITYDSDMEWDLGSPWYRPTRICQAIAGAEYGWRNGSGVWPAYYEDSMAPILNMGPGSPTGVMSGRGAKFPAKYQRTIFALDWTYATIHAIHLIPSGSGYKAEREEFVAGGGLPLTDAVVGKDGAMYFLTGGRRTDSTLWRVTYTGKESTAPVKYESKPQELVDRTKAWDGLASAERLVRFESRVSLEAAGASFIAGPLAKETDAWKIIGGSMALARVGTNDHRAVILSALDRVDWSKLGEEQKITWLRACGLVFIRRGEPSADERAKVLAKIDAAFPAGQESVDRELCRMLSYLQAPGIVTRTLAQMDSAGPTPVPDWLALAKRNARYGRTLEAMVANLPPAQIMHYLYCLRVVKGQWTADERKRFFVWFDRLSKKSGGDSYTGFIADMRKDALDNCTPEERELIAKLDMSTPPAAPVVLPKAQGPGRAWTIDEVVKVAEGGLEKGNRENGKKMFQASMCASCHRFGNEGGGVGPDLTTVGGRFTVRDLAESILDPGKVVSDQYAFDAITKIDGTELFGKVIEEKDQHWIVATNPFDIKQTMEIERGQIKGVKPSPTSPMPPGLIYQLNPEELRDLLSFLMAK